jgi:hypothetical protein
MKASEYEGSTLLGFQTAQQRIQNVGVSFAGFVTVSKMWDEFTLRLL